MRDNGKIIVPASLTILVVILLCLAMVWLVDQGLNGAFKEWFYSRFNSWTELKQFLITTFFTLVFILAICTTVPAYFYARYRSNQAITFINESMSSFMKSNSDELTLPHEYSEIEKQLIKIKTTSQRQQELVQREMQRKNDLITYLAHDLKTPLASVIGYLSLLDEAPDMSTQQKAKYIGIALNKAYRLEELINEFFEITRFNLQSIILNISHIKLAFMLQQMADEFYPMLTPQGKQVAIHVADNLILVGDADKLARVFNNILKNAITYSYENSVIDIAANQQGENVVITFTNVGDTIPAHKLDTIFEKFYRLDSARSTDTGGAGLGLAIAKEIVMAHGGTIAAESSQASTVFTVNLPIRQQK